MPQARSADGVIHNFAEGTDPTVIDRVMKDYAQSHAPPPPPSFASGVGTGLMDKVYGVGQLAQHVFGQEAAAEAGLTPADATTSTKALDTTVQQREKTLEAEGYNKGWGRTVGNVLGDIGITAPLSFIPGGAVVTTLGRIGAGAAGGAAGGAISGATQPVSGENFAREKAGQIGVSSTTGGILGGVLGGVVGPSAVRSVRPEARAAIEKGYVLPPTEIVALGERPSATSKILGAEAGKIKLQQEASTRNQINTNKLAAQEIGLHPDTVLTEQALEQAKVPAKSVYAEMQQAVPEVQLGADGRFRTEIESIGGGKSIVEKFFPKMKDNPAIVALREELLQNPLADTKAVTAKIADLRMQANQNFRAVGDAQKHALALAQREAASHMEDALDRAVSNAPTFNQSRLHAANREQNEATRLLAQERLSEQNAAGFPQSEQVAAARVRSAEQRLRTANAEVQKWRDALQRSIARDAQNQTLSDRFKAARTLFAKIYNVEEATNRTTGNVSAAGLARLYNKGAPLSGDLKTIADAYNTAPKSMQVPEVFGRSEDWSALDFFGTAIAAAAHHPGAILGIMGRPVARRTLLSPRYQRAEATQRPTAPPPSPATQYMGNASPVLGGVVGGTATEAMGLE